jgi:hypothetical protein
MERGSDSRTIRLFVAHLGDAGKLALCAMGCTFGIARAAARTRGDSVQQLKDFDIIAELRRLVPALPRRSMVLLAVSAQ